MLASGPPADGGRRGSGPGDEAEEGPLTAYVIMRPADGSSGLDAPITSETIASLQPRPQMLTAVRATMAARGFTLGPFVGISFAITGPAELFREVFGPNGPSEGEQSERSLDRLDPDLRSAVEAIVFEGGAELFTGDPVEEPAPETC